VIDSSLHSEGRRQAYLAALGIPLWTVRQELTYAAPSTQTQFVAYEDAFFADVTVIEAEPLLEEVPPLIQSKPTPPREPSIISSPPIYDDEPPLDAYLNDPEYQQAAVIDSFKHALAPAAVVPKTAPVMAKPVASQEQPIQFKFGVYACGQWQLIVPRSQLLSPSEAVLLSNIQRVMQTTMSTPLLFTWPMVANYAIPRHKKAAQEALIAFFRNQAVSDKGYILLADYEQELADLLTASTTKPVIIQSSLSIMLQQPAQKKALWLALNQ
jgi:hypothetical protein